MWSLLTRHSVSLRGVPWWGASTLLWVVLVGAEPLESPCGTPGACLDPLPSLWLAEWCSGGYEGCSDCCQGRVPWLHHERCWDHASGACDNPGNLAMLSSPILLTVIGWMEIMWSRHHSSEPSSLALIQNRSSSVPPPLSQLPGLAYCYEEDWGVPRSGA